MTRKGVLRSINSLLDQNCGNCPRRIEFYKSQRKHKHNELDTYCVKQCGTGNKLKQLGQVVVTL